jgi:two-component system chemotaxis sensor kinase CheA
MIVSSHLERYILPLFQVHESVRLSSDMIHKTSGLGNILSLRGEEMPLYRLNALLTSAKGGRPSKALDESIAVIVRYGTSVFAVAVDDIVGQHQVVIKSLGAEMKKMKGFAGGAILGDGKAALILDLPDLIQSVSLGSRRELNSRSVA